MTYKALHNAAELPLCDIIRRQHIIRYVTNASSLAVLNYIYIAAVRTTSERFLWFNLSLLKFKVIDVIYGANLFDVGAT